MTTYLRHADIAHARPFGADRLNPDASYIGTLGEYCGEPVFRVAAGLIEWHHEAHGWADAIGPDAVIVRPDSWTGSCECPRCSKGWTASEGRDPVSDPA